MVTEIRVIEPPGPLYTRAWDGEVQTALAVHPSEGWVGYVSLGVSASDAYLWPVPALHHRAALDLLYMVVQDAARICAGRNVVAAVHNITRIVQSYNQPHDVTHVVEAREYFSSRHESLVELARTTSVYVLETVLTDMIGWEDGDITPVVLGVDEYAEALKAEAESR